MTEEYDIHALARKAEEVRTASPGKRLAIKIGISVAVALVFIVSGSLTAYWFFAKTDFSVDVPLAQTVSQWDPLFLYYGETKNTITNEYGTWADDNNSGLFHNSANNCFIRLIPMGSPSNKEGSDLEDTQNLIAGLGNSVAPVGGAWIPMQDHSGRVEFQAITYTVADTGQPLGGFFRSFGKSGSNLAITVGCEENPTLLEQIMQEQVAGFNLGISLTTENRLTS